MKKVKKFKSDGQSEDEAQLWSEEAQQQTNSMVKEIEKLQKEKQAEIKFFFICDKENRFVSKPLQS